MPRGAGPSRMAPKVIKWVRGTKGDVAGMKAGEICWGKRVFGRPAMGHQGPTAIYIPTRRICKDPQCLCCVGYNAGQRLVRSNYIFDVWFIENAVKVRVQG